MLRLQDRGPLSRGEVAALAPAVLAAVDRGDLHAEGALLTGVRSLCVCVRFVHAELKGEVRDVAVVGGLAGSPTWRRAFEQALARILPAARLVPPAAEPVLGAALLAAELRQS